MPHRRAKRVLAIVALTTTFIGCSSEPPPASTPTMQKEVIRFFSTPSTFPLLIELSTAYAEQYTHVTFEIQQTSISHALQSTDFASSYLLTQHIPEDIEGWAAPIAHDGIAIVAHPELQISSLSPTQLRAIFQGQVQNWSQLEIISTQPIQVVSREPESDTLKEFQRLVMGRRPITANATLVSSQDQMLNTVMNSRGGIGYLMVSQLPEGMSGITIDGSTPSFETLIQQSYPLRTTLYLVGLEEPVNEYRLFVDWVQGIEGQRIVAASHIPLHPLP